MLYLLAVPAVLLGFTGASLFVHSVLHTTIWNPGTHGFSEVLYAFASAANNNGSAFAGITANTQWMNTTLGLTMLVGRFFLIIPVLAIAGSLARKPKVPTTSGTLATHTPLFGGLVIAVVVIIAGLDVLPGAGARSHPRASLTCEVTVTTTTRSSRPRRRAPEHDPATPAARKKGMFDRAIVGPAIVDSFRKLNPRALLGNPVIFVVEVGSVYTTVLFFRDLSKSTATRERVRRPGHDLFLWATVLFANFAEAMAEGRGKAQAGVAAQDAHRDDGATGAEPTEPSSTSRRPSSTSATSASSRPAR